MRSIIFFFFCFVGSVLSVSGQTRPLAVYEKKIDVSLPFYDIENMIYYQAGKWNDLSTGRYDAQTGLLMFSTGDFFSVLNGVISGKNENHQVFKGPFDIYAREKRTPMRNRRGSVAIMLREKNWAEQKQYLKRLLTKELQSQFETYQLRVEVDEVSKKEKTFLIMKVFSNTGGDEFETTQAQKERVVDMNLDVEPVVSSFMSVYTQRLRNIQRVLIEPYRAKLRAQQQPRKLHTITIDIQALGTYSADKEIFYDVKCSAGWTLKRLEVPIEQAKVMRKAPDAYQIRVSVFEGDMSIPWCPNHNLTAFEYYEVVHKDTQQLLIRTRAYFNHSSDQKYYRIQLKFPSF